MLAPQAGDGLLWHDLTPVLARDCVASIKRWAKRDALGDALMAATDELSAADDKTIQFRLKKPFPLLPVALGKVGSPMPAMMPERLANTDPFKQITEIIGSGPFRYKMDERLQGSRNVYEKFAQYRPREGGAPDWTSGPKIVHFDRVEWTTIPDAATAGGALQNNEQEWWEQVAFDLVPLLKKNPKLKVYVADRTGAVEMMRPNHLQNPFSNPGIRRALFGAIDQASFMQAIVGDDAEMFHTPLGVFTPGTPMASEAGLEPYRGKRDYAKVKEELKAAGYAGEKTALLVPTDYITLKALGDVAADMMQKIGMNVDYVATDWNTMLQRRNNKGTPEQGGWSAFITGWAGSDWMNPAGHIAMRGNGDAPSAWPGWSVSPRIEELRQDWFDAPDLAAQQQICAKIQRQCMIDVPYYSLGQFQQPIAHRSDLVGVLPGFSTFWNVRRG